MNEYTKPVVEVTALNNEEVITASGGINTTKFTDASTSKGYNVIDNF